MVTRAVSITLAHSRPDILIKLSYIYTLSNASLRVWNLETMEAVAAVEAHANTILKVMIITHT